MRPPSALIIPLLMLAAATLLPAQDFLTVPSAAYPTIQSAISAVPEDGVVFLMPGTYTESIVVNGKQLTLEGSTAGSVILDGTLSQRVLELVPGPGETIVVKNMTICDGAAFGSSSQAFENQGGGLHVADAASPATAGTVILQDCVIDNCRAANGGGIYNGLHQQLMLQDCSVTNNGPGATYASMVSLPSGFGVLCRGDLTATGCTFANNVAGPAANGAGSGGAIRIEALASQSGFDLDCTDCVFDGNEALRGAAVSAVSQMGLLGAPGSIELQSCRVVNNGQSASLARAPFELIWCDLWARSSLFAGNETTLSPDLVDGARRLELIHCTLIGNGPAGGQPSAGTALTTYGSIANIRSCLVLENTALVPFEPLPGASPPSVVDSLLLQPPVPGFPKLDPGFVDPAAGDFRLLPGSPAVDTGAAIYGLGTDVDGQPRTVGGAPDIGCYELQTTGAAVGMDGTVVDTTGNPVDVLLVNGGSGGARRKMEFAPGVPVLLEVDLPPTRTQPADFVIWGRLGVPRPDELTDIFFAGGQMAFSPPDIAPLDPNLFIFTYSLVPAWSLFPSNAAPWVLSVPTFPQPVTFTLQGLIETGPTEVRITNGITITTYSGF